MSDYSNGLKIGNRIIADQAIQGLSSTGLGAIDAETSLISDPQSFNLDPYAGLATFRGKTIAPLTGSFSVTSHIDTGLSLAVPSNGVITYGFFTGNHAVGLNNNPSFGEGKGYSPFNELQKTAAINAMGLWDDLVSLSFKNVGDVSTSGWAKNDATILLANTTTGPAQAWAYYPGGNHQYARISSDVYTADPAVNNTNVWFDFGGYGNTTLIHELGHTLGLSHPGAYNFGPGFDVNYVNGAEYAQDSMQYSIMSYWSGSETGQITRDWLSQQANYPQTPMLHDIFVIQQKYGADPTTRAGDTVYGFNSNAGKDVYDFTKNPYPNISIYDAKGNDTLDLSGSNAGNFINLHPGTYSSVGQAVPTLAAVNEARVALGTELGITLAPYTQATLDARQATFLPAIESRIFSDTGIHGVNATQYDNLSIAYNTIIENATGGSQRDVIWGNDVANVLKGMAGDDVLRGYGGNDTLIGGTGNDTLTGDAGNDIFVFAKDGSTDTITDFQTGADKVDLRGVAGATSAWVSYDSVSHQLKIDTDHNGTFDLFINSQNTISNSDILFAA
jgi:serralysin